MEILSSFIVSMGVLHALNCQYAYDIFAPNLYTLNFVSAMALLACIYDVVFDNLQVVSVQANITRSIKGPCLSYLLLLPAASLMAVLGDDDKDDATIGYIEQFTTIVLKVSSINQLHIAVQDYVDTKGEQSKAWYGAVFAPWAALASAHAWYTVSAIGVLKPLVLYTFTAGMFTFHRKVLPDISSSFSLAESSIVCQGLTMYLFKVEHLIRTGSEVEQFVNVAVLSALLVFAMLTWFPVLRKSRNFFLTNAFVATGVSFPVLYSLLGQNYISWLYSYVRRSHIRIILSLYWLLIGLICAFIVSAIYNSKFTLHCDEVWPRRNAQRWRSLLINSYKKKRQPVVTVDVKRDPSVSTNLRKIFHFMAVLTFIPGLKYDVAYMNCVATCACIVYSMVECMRVLKIEPFGEYFEAYLGSFRDSQDQGLIISRPIYLMAGFTLPLWLHQCVLCDTLSLNSGVLALGVGDTFAALVGSKFGKKQWPQTNRSMEGAAAFTVSTLLAVAILCLTTVTRHQTVTNIVLAVCLTACLESFTSQIDNLVLPIYMFTLLIC